jgi:hypothetical protein
MVHTSVVTMYKRFISTFVFFTKFITIDSVSISSLIIYTRRLINQMINNIFFFEYQGGTHG